MGFKNRTKLLRAELTLIFDAGPFGELPSEMSWNMEGLELERGDEIVITIDGVTKKGMPTRGSLGRKAGVIEW